MPYGLFLSLRKRPRTGTLIAFNPNTILSFVAQIFYPFIQMPHGWTSSDSVTPHSDYPTKRDIANNGTSLLWGELMKRCGFTTIAEMSKAVNSGIIEEFGREIYVRPELTTKLDQVLNPYTFYPSEDDLSILLVDKLVKILRSNGATKMKYATINGDSGIYDMEQLNLNTKIELTSGPKTIADETEDFIVTWFYDEVSALILAKEDASAVLKKEGLEGIVFSKETPLIWENHQYHLL